MFKYVLISEKGVISRDLQNAIPAVCEAITDNDKDFINVDLPPALGPLLKYYLDFFFL